MNIDNGFVSIWDMIASHLQDSGFDVYSPGVREGKLVTSPYIVLKDAGTNQYNNYSSTVSYYDIMLYVPFTRYSAMHSEIEYIKEAMKELRPTVLPTNYVSTPYYDDTVKGYMVSLQYKNYRKISNFKN